MKFPLISKNLNDRSQNREHRTTSFIALLSVTSIGNTIPSGKTTNMPRTSSSSGLRSLGTWQDVAWDSALKILVN